jgi:hypothetical protein
MLGLTFIKLQPKYFSKGDIVLDYSPMLPDSEPYEVVSVYKHNIHLKNVNSGKQLALEYNAKSYWYCIELNNGHLG